MNQCIAQTNPELHRWAYVDVTQQSAKNLNSTAAVVEYRYKHDYKNRDAPT